MLALAAMLPMQATTWQAKTDTIWPARHYREIHGLPSGSQRSDTYINWNYTEGTTLVYGIHFPMPSSKPRAARSRHSAYASYTRRQEPSCSTRKQQAQRSRLPSRRWKSCLIQRCLTTVGIVSSLPAQMARALSTVSTCFSSNVALHSTLPTPRYSWHQAYTFGGVRRFPELLLGRATTGPTLR